MQNKTNSELDAYGIGIPIAYGGYAVGTSTTGLPISQPSSLFSSRLSTSAALHNYTADQLRALRSRTQADCIAHLAANRHAFTLTELKQAVRMPEMGDEEMQRLKDSLAKNVKVSYDTTTQSFTYKPTFPGLHCAADVDAFLRIPPQCYGVKLSDLSDAYVGVESDIEQLFQQGKLYQLEPSEKSRVGVSPIVFPIDPSTTLPQDPDLKRLWSSVRRPHTETDRDIELFKAGHLTARQMRLQQLAQSKQYAAKNKRKREEAERNKKPRKRYMRQKITNVHLVEELPWLKATNK